MGGVPELMPVSEDFLSVNRWEEALHEIRPRKAVPRGEAQIETWKQQNAKSLSDLSTG